MKVKSDNSVDKNGKIVWEFRTLRLYVPFWVNGTKKKLKCVACKKKIDMHGRTYHFQLCEACRLLMFPLAMPRRDRDGSWL
jgi:hypothetical protein